MRKSKKKQQPSSSYVFPSREKKKVSFICPHCKNEIVVPFSIVKDFSPGGKEYHPGGTSSLVCPILSRFHEDQSSIIGGFKVIVR